MCKFRNIFGNDVVKMLLAGAGSVQIVSTLYRNKIEVIGKMLSDIEKWMDAGGYKNIESLRAGFQEILLTTRCPYAQRAQYVDLMLNAAEILKKYKIIN